MIFKDGELVEFYLETEQGIINFASDVKLEGEPLILYNILIYGNKNFPLKGKYRIVSETTRRTQSTCKARWV